jgi:hypothetical protein
MVNNADLDDESEFTPKQVKIIAEARELMPDSFSDNTSDEKILAYAELVLSDINVFPPLTNFSTGDIPENMLPVLYFGITVFTALFLSLNATLQDFTYNDNGLTVQIDQVGKIGAVYTNLLEMYRFQITNFKKTQIMAVGGKGLGSPRFQSQIGQFLKIALGSAFTWNQP